MMEKLFTLLVFLLMAVPVRAQTNPPVRLALISETDGAATAADVLTAQFSSNPQIQLLERDQIAKVYREQSLSAANTDYLKLGQLLGADGLLLLQTNWEGTNQILNLRLVAVKPGVVLIGEKFPWPQDHPSDLSAAIASQIGKLLPKLTVAATKAIPLSVVNLRSSLTSSNAAETERQLKLLVIQRLTQEPQLFVLERQKMQLLSDEKDLNPEGSPFWNGSFLLEGVIDQNGYSTETITINARLTPPKGGAPMLFDVSSSRTNLAAVINQLAAKVTAALKVQSTTPAWNATDEAAQYFAEAKWAMRWGLFAEAQASADSAWALGKKDLECAILRIRAYVGEVHTSAVGYQNFQHSFSSGFDSQGAPLGPPPSEEKIQAAIQECFREYPNCVAYQATRYESQSAVDITGTLAVTPLEMANLDRAKFALELYDDFNRGVANTAMDGDFLAQNPAWYHLGIEDLTAASMVLRDFNFVPAAQERMADKLAELRALTRKVALWMARSPSVHDSYFVGDRRASYNELAPSIIEAPNLYNCEVKWGSFWQEHPEAGIQLYRELMASPVFGYLHGYFWNFDLSIPRLAAWTEPDRQRLPAIWENFLLELKHSADQRLRLEGSALVLAGTQSEQTLAAAFTNFFDGMLANHDDFATNQVEQLYLNWGVQRLVSAKAGSGIGTDVRSALEQRYTHEYDAKLSAMDQEYWNQTIPGGGSNSWFLTQMRYLQRTKAFDLAGFVQLFEGIPHTYSSEQALEILPLLANLKSNLTAQTQGSLITQNPEAKFGLEMVEEVEVKAGNFQNQKKYLQSNQPFVLGNFMKLFFFDAGNYSPDQAREILPLLAAYKSNLVAQTAATTVTQNPSTGGAIWHVADVEAKARQTLNPPVARIQSKVHTSAISIPAPAPVSVPAVNHQPVAKVPETITNALLVDQFLTIPLEGLPGDNISNAKLKMHHWQDGKLLFDMQYESEMDTFDDKGALKSTHNATLPAFAILDPMTTHWDVIACAKRILADNNNYYHHSVLAQGKLFSCNSGQIMEFDFSNRQWKNLEIAGRENYELFAIAGQVYAANRNTIFEIATNETSTHILAASRRNPSQSILDKIDDLGTPILFEGANHSLRAVINGNIYTWNQSDWQKDGSLPPSRDPQLCNSGLLSIRNTFSDQNPGIFLLSNLSNDPEYYFTRGSAGQESLPKPDMLKSPTSGIQASAASPPHPAWIYPENMRVDNLALTFHQSDFVMLSDHSDIQMIKNVADGYQHPKVVGQNGYQAELLNFTPDLPEPQKIFLNFDDSKNYPPLAGSHANWGWIVQHESPPTWILFAGDFFCMGLESPPSRMGGNQINTGSQPGIWVIPVSQLTRDWDRQKTEQSAALKQAQKSFMAKYDLNQDGIFSPEEKEQCLDKTEFIETELDVIDANHNGLLDVDELAWFDANQNESLDPKEKAGLNLAQHLLAQRLLEKFDRDGNGLIGFQEFNDLANFAIDSKRKFIPGSLFLDFDLNHDGNVDLGEMESFLKKRTFFHLNSLRGMAHSSVYSGYDQSTGPPPKFIIAVQNYWQNTEGNSRRMPFNGDFPFNPGFAPNRMHTNAQPNTPQ